MIDGESVEFESFYRIRNWALLLSVGKKYLCEAPFLIKCGKELEQALEDLAKDIRGLKKRFPGKFAQDIDTDGMLKGMQDVARHLKSPDRPLQERCFLGELGKDLEERLSLLVGAVEKIRLHIEGASPKHSSNKFFSGAFYRTGRIIGSGLSIVGRVAGLVFLVLAAVLGYMFATMEREGGLKKEISLSHEQISVLGKKLSDLEDDMLPIVREIEDHRRRGTARSDMVRTIELTVKLGELEQKALDVKGRLDFHQSRLTAAEASLETLQSKSFLERLFRRPFH